jgi:fibronectin type III domain protein
VLSALLVFVPSAWGASSNLLPNGSFQSGTSGWVAADAAFTIATDGYDGDGAAGRLALNTTATRYTLSTKPRPVQSTTAGTVYTSSGVVRSDTPGKSVCLVVKEITSGGSVVQTQSGCATTTLQWAPFPQVSLTTQNDGDQITVVVRQSNAVAGDSFEVDALSLLANAGDTTPPTTPTNVSATAVSSSEIDVSWSASSDLDFGGVAGYAIYRDGGSSAIGTVSGSTTAFADRSLAPNTTHTYTVAAFDAAGNYSPQSAVSNPATTLSAPASSVVGLWHLDETSGSTAYDSSGFGHNGSISGPVTLGVPGEAGTAYSFVPKSTVIVPNAPDLVPGTANITISYWLNTTILPCCNGIDYDMFTKGDSSSKGGQIKLEVQENGQASCMFRGNLGSRQLIAGPSVVDGLWHYVICQRLGNQIVETVDGQTYSVTKATGNITVTDEIRLGSHLGGGDWYNGVLDEVTYSIG